MDLDADNTLRLHGPVLRPPTTRIPGQRASSTSWGDARAVRNLRAMHGVLFSPEQVQENVGLAR